MTDLKEIKFFKYKRKSTESAERQVASIGDQETAINQMIQKENLNVVGDFEETKSAKQPGRPKFNEMILRIENGEADGILCWAINRLARNPIDHGKISWLLQEGRIKVIVTPTRTFIPEDAGLLMGIEGGQATDYVIRLSKDVKRGLENKVARGWRPGPVPQGYVNDISQEQGNRGIAKDPERFDLVRKMWDLMLTGTYSVSEILETANGEWGYRTRRTRRMGGKPLAKSMIYKIFTDPFYCGEFVWPPRSDSMVAGAHEPMITKEEFDRVQILLGRKGRPRPKRHEFPFVGIMRCGGCGASITCEEKWKKQQNGNLHHYIYYHCTKRKDPACTQGSIESKKLMKQIDEYLYKIAIKEDYAKFAIEYLNKANEREVDDRNTILKTNHNSYNDCLKRLDNLNRIFISPDNSDYSLMSSDEYKAQKSQLFREKSQLEANLRETEQRAEQWLELSERTFNFCAYARYWLKYGDSKQQKAILMALGSNHILKDQKLAINLYDHWKLIETSLNSPSQPKEMLEPVLNGSCKRKTAEKSTVCPRMRGFTDDVRTYFMRTNQAVTIPALSPAL